MNNDSDGRIWASCCLGYRVAGYLSEHSKNCDLHELIAVLRQIANGDLVLTDPGENAARYPDFKELSHSVGGSLNKSDRDLATQALKHLAEQQDD